MTTYAKRETAMPGQRQQGFSLIEMMIALTIGLIMSSFLIAVLVNTNEANREVDRSNRQIENARYAVDILRSDIRLAGYYGDYARVLPAAAALPAMCDVTNLLGDMLVPIHGLDQVAGTELGACPGGPRVIPQTDIVVIRRVDTNPVCGTDTDASTPAAPTAGESYVQSSAILFNVQTGGGTFAFGQTGADGVASSMCRKVQTVSGAQDHVCPTATITPNGSGTCAGFTAAGIRQLHVLIYFVSPCNDCALGDGIPTLKRARLSGGTYVVEALVEGIEDLQVQYGVDTSAGTDVVGYGSPDKYMPSTAEPVMAMSDWANTVTARIFVLARNVDTTPGHVDKKRYILGTKTIEPIGDAYKRHAFSTLIRLENLSARREIPI